MKAFFGRLPEGRVGVKICGITNPLDATICVEAGVDAVGLNFYPASKRFVDLRSERDWICQVPETLARVAVVVNPTVAEAKQLLDEPFIDALQLHGDETPEFCDELRRHSGKTIIKALRVQDATTLRSALAFAGFPILLDAFASGRERGGTGHVFDWAMLEGFPLLDQVILSGGLNPLNLESALRLTRVRFVDVASGSEEHPRKKSREKILSLVATARKSQV